MLSKTNDSFYVVRLLRYLTVCGPSNKRILEVLRFNWLQQYAALVVSMKWSFIFLTKALVWNVSQVFFLNERVWDNTWWAHNVSQYMLNISVSVNNLIKFFQNQKWNKVKTRQEKIIFSRDGFGKAKDQNQSTRSVLQKWCS